MLAAARWRIPSLEEDATGIHSIATASGWGFYTQNRVDTLYPDIFIASHVSSRETRVTGYVNAGGFWGLLYCGSTIQTGDEPNQQRKFDVAMIESPRRFNMPHEKRRLARKRSRKFVSNDYSENR